MSSHRQPVVEALSPVHGPASTTFNMLGDAFITSFCTGHGATQNKVPVCGCLLSLRPSDFAEERLLKVFSDAWGRSFPLQSSLFGLEVSRCLYTFITSFCTGHVTVSNNVRACGCMLSHRPSDFAGERLPKVWFDAWSRSFPLPSLLFGLKTSRRLFAEEASLSLS